MGDMRRGAWHGQDSILLTYTSSTLYYIKKEMEGKCIVS
jgi:hypothetical protein